MWEMFENKVVAVFLVDCVLVRTLLKFILTAMVVQVKVLIPMIDAILIQPYTELSSLTSVVLESQNQQQSWRYIETFYAVAQQL